MVWCLWTYRPRRGLPRRIASVRNVWPRVNACIVELLGTSSTNVHNTLPLRTAVWLWQPPSIRLPNLTCCSERAGGKLAVPCQPVGTGMGHFPSFSSFPCLQLPAVVGRGVEGCELEGENLFVAATLHNGDHSIQTSTIIDTGATGFVFIDENFVCQQNFPQYRLNPPQDLEVINGRPIESGQITHLTKISYQIQDHTETLPAFITKLGHFSLVLGIYWLQRYAVVTDFVSNSVRFQCPDHRNPRVAP